ncbi:hypothetical protein AbraIFM66950_000380 [Aspergillus brasiliensis]|nr:hypothetical protein AbraIFM66950_000380 [Aspergillus brasiliensis]
MPAQARLTNQTDANSSSVSSNTPPRGIDDPKIENVFKNWGQARRDTQKETPLAQKRSEERDEEARQRESQRHSTSVRENDRD